jgi:hypothetical protein
LVLVTKLTDVLKSEIGRDRIEMLRVEGKDRLQTLQGVKERKPARLKVSMARP